MSFDDGMKAFKAGMYQQAAESFVSVTNNDDQNHKAWNALGICLSKIGDYEQATICFNNALLLSPNNNIYERNNEKNFLKMQKTLEKNCVDASIQKTPPKEVKRKKRALTIPLSGDIKSNNNYEEEIIQYLQVSRSISDRKTESKCLLCGGSKGLIGLFRSNKTCNDCSEKLDNLKNDLYVKVLNTPPSFDTLTSTEREFIQILTPMQQYQIMNKIFQENHELYKQPLNSVIESILPHYDLYSTNEEFLKFFYLHYLTQYLNINGNLPLWPGVNPRGILIPLSSNEKIHLIIPAKLKEPVSRRRNYNGISQGYTFRVAKGVRYRVSTNTGQSERITSFEEVSKGYLFVTNKRIQLIPVNGNKHANIPLNKISSFVLYETDTLEIHKTGREKPFRFMLPSGTTADLTNFCITNLIGKSL